MSTPSRQLADLLIEGGLDEFVRSRREGERPRAWRLIARDIWEATDGKLDLTYETLRSWYPEDRSELTEAKAVGE